MKAACLQTDCVFNRNVTCVLEGEPPPGPCSIAMTTEEWERMWNGDAPYLRLDGDEFHRESE